MIKKWRVETQATVKRVYEVEADDMKDAEAKSVDADMLETEDIWEETHSITELSADEDRER